MIKAYVNMFKNWNNFHGRASRGDYWWAVLANMIAPTVLGILIGIVTFVLALISEDLATVIGGILTGILGIYSLIVLVPGIALSVRRLHDTGRSGMVYVFCMLGSLCCGIGSIVMLVFCCLPGNPGPNQYGPDPKGFNSNGMGYGQPMGGQNMYNQQNWNNNQGF